MNGTRTNKEQGLLQFFALITTLGISLISGLFTGRLLNTRCWRNKKTYFEDKENWDVEENEDRIIIIGN